MSTAAIIAGTTAAASLGGAAISSNAAGNAASTQANAADQAAQLQYQASQNALNFQEQQWQQSQANIAPWLQSGAGALSNLDYLLGINPASTSQAPFSSGGTVAPGGTQPTGGPSQPIRPGGMLTAQGGPAPSLGGNDGSFQPQGGPAWSVNSGFDGSFRPQGGPAAGVGGNGIWGAPQAWGGPTAQGGPAPTIGNGTIRPRSMMAPIETPSDGGLNLSTPNGSPAPSVPTGGTPSPITASPNTSLGGFGSLMQAYPGGPFVAPTGLTEQNDPGYQARLNLGQQAFEQSAAARGNVLTGGTAQAENQLAQDYASNEYNNVYNRALSGYDTNFNTWNTGQTNQFNRLAALSGVGQTAANQLGNLGVQASNSITGNILGTAGAIGQQMNNAAAANASGIVGSANAWGGALGNTGNNISQLLLLQQLQNGGGGGGLGGGVGTSNSDFYGQWA